jgi:hypothetical protein
VATSVCPLAVSPNDVMVGGCLSWERIWRTILISSMGAISSDLITSRWAPPLKGPPPPHTHNQSQASSTWDKPPPNRSRSRPGRGISTSYGTSSSSFLVFLSISILFSILGVHLMQEALCVYFTLHAFVLLIISRKEKVLTLNLTMPSWEEVSSSILSELELSYVLCIHTRGEGSHGPLVS